MPGSCLWCGQPTDAIDVYCSRDCEADHGLAKEDMPDYFDVPDEEICDECGHQQCVCLDELVYDDWRSEDMYDCG